MLSAVEERCVLREGLDELNVWNNERNELESVAMIASNTEPYSAAPKLFDALNKSEVEEMLVHWRFSHECITGLVHRHRSLCQIDLARMYLVPL